MKFILIDPGISIGGIEVLMADFAKYLSDRGIDVIFMVGGESKSIYYELIHDNYNIKFCEIKGINNTVYYSKKNSVYHNDRTKIFELINKKEQIYVVTCFFYTLQYAMNIFESYSEYTKILQVWSHPLEWIHRLIHNKDYVYKKKKNSLYYYQRNLLQKITNQNASHFISKSIFDFNNWYYEAELICPKGEKMWCAPVRFNRKIVADKISNRKITNRLRVLWIGRLTYFKSDAIIHIFESLEKMRQAYPSIHFVFNIIGDGSEKDRNYVKARITPQNVSVKFWGMIKPEDLYEHFKNNDIGVSMGLSVKIMAANGLPAILIDSMDRRYTSEKNCNWIFETDDGDAGDGLYYQIMGCPLDYRRRLVDILESVLKGDVDLNEYSVKSKEYVDNKYSYEKKYDDLYEEAINSEFRPNTCNTFHYNICIRFVFKIYKGLKRVKDNVKKSYTR